MCGGHVVVDSTGLKVYGAGEWHADKHGVSARRTWRKLHRGVDETTKDIVAVEVTASNVHDGLVLPDLLEQVPDSLHQVSGDGGYDTRSCYEAVLDRGAEPVFIPRKNTPGDSVIERRSLLVMLHQGASRQTSGTSGALRADARARQSSRTRCADSRCCSV